MTPCLLSSLCSNCCTRIDPDAAPVTVLVGAHRYPLCSLQCHKRWAEISDLSKLPVPAPNRSRNVAFKIEAPPNNVLSFARPKRVPKPPKPKLVRGSPEWAAMIAARAAKAKATWAKKSDAELASHAAKIARGRARRDHGEVRS